jgi:hypothetical protein
MALNTEEVVVSVTGAIYSFPTTEDAPTDHNGALPLVTKEHGYTSEEGVEVSATKSITNILAWQNASIVRSVVTESSIEVSFTLIQDNEDNRELFYGVAANGTGGYEWNPANSGGRKSFVIDAIDTAENKKVRYYFPSAEITSVEAVTLNSSTPISFGITLTAYKVADGYNSIVWHGDLEDES